MIALTHTLPVTDIVQAGYALFALLLAAAAAVLTRDGTRIFMGDHASEDVLHQRRYATSLARAVSRLTGGLFAVVVGGLVAVMLVSYLT